jgi:AraC-like DNA-binding protein
MFNTIVEKLLDSYVAFSEFRDIYIEAELSNILCALLKQVENTGSSYIPENYKYIVHYMECNYMRNLSLEELAAMCNVSKYHFCREFRKYTSHTPNGCNALITYRGLAGLASGAQPNCEWDGAGADGRFRNTEKELLRIKHYY